MTTSQMDSQPRLSEEDRRMNTCGLGWRIFGLGVGANLGELLPAQAFGHHGATGTLMWMDPTRNAYAVMLTSRPFDQSATRLMKLSNAISAALLTNSIRQTFQNKYKANCCFCRQFKDNARYLVLLVS